jgi:ABC-2 type transport system permease protein
MLAMPSRTSWVNKEIISLILRNTGWIGIVYTVGLLFALPLNIGMMVSSDESSYLFTYGHMFQVNFVLQAGLMMVIPVLLSIFLFRYLHVKQHADMIHSLPIKRKKLFIQFSAAGLIMLLIPVLITAVVMIMITLTNDLGPNFQVADIINWAMLTFLMTLLFYTSGITVAMMTGLSVVQAVMTYLLLLFPSGIYVLSVLNLKNFLYGFPQDYFMAVQTENFSPVIKAGLFNEVQLSSWEVVIYLVIIIGLWLLALFLYKMRRIESVSQALVFPVLQPIFKFGLITSVMLLSGGYFSEMQNTLSWTLFGYAIGFVIGYILSEMVLQKTWRIVLKVKEVAVFALFIAIIAVFFQFGFRNYVTYIPDSNEIDKVYFNDHIYSYLNEYEEEPVRYLKNEDNIMNVRELHKAVISNRDSKGQHPLYIVYELKNGKKIVRSYEINRDRFDSLYESIYESVEYKESTNRILTIDSENADKLTITARGPHNKQVSITASDLLKEGIDVLKKEVLDESYESMIDPSETLYEMELLLSNDRRVYMEWKPSYKNFKEWLIDNGLFNQVKVTADDVSKILVFKREDHQAVSGLEVDFHESISKLEEEGKAMTITSDQQVEDLLKMTSWTMESDYMAAFYFKGEEYPDVKGITAKEAPDYIIDRFEK